MALRDHVLTGRTSNNAHPIPRVAIRRFIKDVADFDGSLLPVTVHLQPGSVHDMSASTKHLVVLPHNILSATCSIFICQHTTMTVS